MKRPASVPAAAALALVLVALPPPQAHGQAAEAAALPRIEVVAPASPLPAKERINVFLEIVNLGPGDAENLSVFVQPGPASDLVIVGQVERGLRDLPENASDLLVVRVATPPDAGGASLSLRFTFDVPGAGTVVVERQANLLIEPANSDPLEIELVDPTLRAGERDELTLQLHNPDESRISDLDLLLEVERELGALPGLGDRSPSVSPGRGSSFLLQGATLEPGATGLVKTNVLTALRPDELVVLKLTASYNLEGFERLQPFEFGVRVVGGVNLRILEAREVDTGAGLEVEGTLVNVGTGTAWNPRLTAAEGSGLRSPEPVLLEDLEPNEAVSFRLPVERIGEGTPAAALFDLDWNDDYGNVATAQAVEGPLTPLPPPPPTRLESFWGRFTSLPAWAWALAGLALAGLVLLALVRFVRARRAAAEEEAEPIGPTPTAPDEPETSGTPAADDERRWRGGRKGGPGARPGG